MKRLPRDIVRRFLGDRRGAIAAMTALLATVLLGFAGVGAETAFWYAQKRALQTQADADKAVRLVFNSAVGLAIMRFIAFAYTYHYLNWFSKTSLIKWHQIVRTRLWLLVALWVICIALYLYDYGLGLKVLMCLSLMHVYLEFPLNHISIIGTFRELLAGHMLKRGQA